MLFVLLFLYIIVDEISSAFASSSSSSILSLSSFRSVLSNNNNLILATGSACPSNPGIVCSHDYLLVDVRISNVYNEVEMINSSSSSSSLSSSSTSISSGSFSLNSIDYNKLYAPDESYLVEQIYDPISNVYGLQFTSN
ncbi:unnamed protein product [Schistosoma intercalatum]|nr:unnamed protein product [Schistosoma intercalatum]